MIYEQILKKALPRILLALVVMGGASLAGTRQDSHKDEQETPRMTVADLMARLEKHAPVVIVDSRSESSWEGSDKQIKGSVRIPIDQIEARMSDLPKDKEIVIYCSWPSEATSARAAQQLLDKGYKKVYALKGGWNAWLEQNGPVEPKAEPKPDPKADPKAATKADPKKPDSQ